jgi:hypothetical protein
MLAIQEHESFYAPAPVESVAAYVSSKTKLRFKETIEPAASSSYITVNSALPIPKRNRTLSQGNLAGNTLEYSNLPPFANSFDFYPNETNFI